MSLGVSLFFAWTPSLLDLCLTSIFSLFTLQNFAWKVRFPNSPIFCLSDAPRSSVEPCRIRCKIDKTQMLLH